MSAGLAHEFKNAIAALHGYAQFMQSLDLDEGGQTAAASLLQEVRGLSDMVTAFLNFARPQPLQVEDVSLWELIEECKREVETVYQLRSIEITLSGGDLRATQIPGDARMLRQAILNLMRNAAEAIPEDAAERRVSVSLSRASDHAGKDWIRIEIRDTGPGIPPADLTRIFIPFFTTKAQGHGIGLALAHRVITEHGGTLTANNSPSGGAIFSIVLPASG
jgi:signal transduction histidine kinase